MDRDPGLIDDSYGWSVSVDGSIAAVGAPDDDGAGVNAGAVWVYQFDGAGWVEQVKIAGMDTASGDFFGNSVSVSGERIVVGAPGDDDNGSRSGSVYVFEFDGSQWAEAEKLTTLDGGSTDFFGAWVGVDGDRIVAGANRDDDNGQNAGAAYVFARTGDDWVQEAKLIASDGIEFGEFGMSVAIADELIVVGATGDDSNGVSSGAAYIYRYMENEWVEDMKLIASDGIAADFFGEAVDVSEGRVIVGSRWDDDLGSSSGSAYVFAQEDGVWGEQGKLLASDGAAGDSFGFSVSIDGNFASVSAIQTDSGNLNAIKAYLFAFGDGGWDESAIIIDSGVSGTENTSSAVDLSGDSVFVGSIGRGKLDGFFWQGGIASVFDISCFRLCSADLTLDGDLNFFDVSAFLSLFAASDVAADFDGDGDLNFFDVSAFLAAFASGCP
ncbi:MAG: GC-type dockerin domain-anchored protein [Phycisphaerales bacterium]